MRRSEVRFQADAEIVRRPTLIVFDAPDPKRSLCGRFCCDARP
jgi:hypothetical protein